MEHCQTAVEPKGTKGKAVHIKMRPANLEVGLKGSDLMFAGELGGEIKVDESMWNLESNEVIIISMLKSVQTWWGSIIKVHFLIMICVV